MTSPSSNHEGQGMQPGEYRCGGFDAQSALPRAAGLAELLADYDACPRVESKYRVAHDALRKMCLSLGMPPYPFAVVAWARAALTEPRP